MSRSRRILVVCANPALELTYWVPRLSDDLVTADRAQLEPGGKGTNVARILQFLGADVTLALPLGGELGSAMRSRLVAEQVQMLEATHSKPTRCSVVLVAADRAEPLVVRSTGARYDASEAAALSARMGNAVASDRWNTVVLAGSLPPGVTSELYPDLIRAAKGRGAKVIVDAGGDLLQASLTARPYAVTPNLHEASLALGADITAGNVARSARRLAREAELAVITGGEQGSWACDGGRVCHVRVRALSAAHGTGAGDAFCAGLALTLAAGATHHQALTHASTLGASAALVSGSGRLPAVQLTPDQAGVSVQMLG